MMKKMIIFTLFATQLTPLFAAQSAPPVPHLSSLSLEQKIGQLIMMATVSAPDLNPDFMRQQPYTLDPEHARTMIKMHHIGGIIFLGAGTPEQQAEMTQQLQTLSQHPLLVGLDAEWGLSMRHQKGVITFPRAMTLGALAPEDEHLIYDLGQEIGRQCKALGVHINFAPVADVNNNPRNPIINTRSFGEIPEAVAHKAALFMRGMQDAGILACAKHFPGHGDTETDSHHARGVIPYDLEHLEAVELAPFKALIADGVDAVMTAHLDVPALSPGEKVPATLSRKILTDQLRIRLGFKGLTITDGLGMKGVTDDFPPGQLEVHAIKAGNDIVLCPVDVPLAIQRIKDAVAAGELTEAEIDERVARILQAKEKVMQSAHAPFAKDTLITPHARDLKRNLYRAAVTLARDRKQVVPLKSDRAVSVKTFGSSDAFVQRLKKRYTDLAITAYALHATEDEIDDDDDAEHVIVSVHLEGRSGMIEQTADAGAAALTQPAYVSFIQKHADKVTLALFGNPYNLSQFENVPAVIVGYENEPEAQEAGADVLLGTHSAQGTLPVTPAS